MKVKILLSREEIVDILYDNLVSKGFTVNKEDIEQSFKKTQTLQVNAEVNAPTVRSVVSVGAIVNTEAQLPVVEEPNPTTHRLGLADLLDPEATADVATDIKSIINKGLSYSKK